jgi:hypothetical protein
MRRLLLIVVLLAVVVAVGGFFALGIFAPEPHPQQIEKTLPNDRFQHGN